MVKILANSGKDFKKNSVYERRHDGSLGWIRAQETEDIAGCAADVMGEIDVSDRAIVSLALGNNIGDMKGLQHVRRDQWS